MQETMHGENTRGRSQRSFLAMGRPGGKGRVPCHGAQSRKTRMERAMKLKLDMHVGVQS